MKKKHALDDKAKQALEFLIAGTCSSVNAAVIMALGGKDTTNEAQIKSVKRRFSKLGYDKLLADVRDSGTSTVEQAKIIDLRRRAEASLGETEELYYELSLLEGNADCFGTTTLIGDLTSIVDKYTDYNLDTVELLTEAFAASLSRLLRNSWQTGDSAKDKFGNELLSPTLTITIECDPSRPELTPNSLTRRPGVSANGNDTTILIQATTPIDGESKRKNIQEWLKRAGNHQHAARA